MDAISEPTCLALVERHKRTYPNRFGTYPNPSGTYPNLCEICVVNLGIVVHSNILFLFWYLHLFFWLDLRHPCGGDAMS